MRTTRDNMNSLPKGSQALARPIRLLFPPQSTIPPTRSIVGDPLQVCFILIRECQPDIGPPGPAARMSWTLTVHRPASLARHNRLAPSPAVAPPVGGRPALFRRAGIPKGIAWEAYLQPGSSPREC